MSHGSEMPQMTRQLVLPFGDRGEAPRAKQREEELKTIQSNERTARRGLMEEVVTPSNLRAALKRVTRNKGSPGVDGMSVEELSGYLAENWLQVREQLLAGQYQPQPVKRQVIPKSGGGERELGIPTVLDRFIQQALLQVLQPQIDSTFSAHSYGFRPGRSAHQAVKAARSFVQEGRRIVVDVDLSKFFDRVNHDVLMGRVSKRIADGRVLRLIRRYLQAGVMSEGVVMRRHEGTPQGGPLSPLLANLLLDEVDKELEARGHAFARYADDCNVYVKSKRAGERVMKLLRRTYAGLRLQINEEKSGIAPASQRQFLGFSLWTAPGKVVKHRVASKALSAMKDRVRELTSRSSGRSLRQTAGDLRSYLLGWKGYFRLADTPNVFRKLDEWIRHRLRAIQLKHWKRGKTIYRELVARGMTGEKARQVARNGRRWWRNSGMAIHIALPNSTFDQLGIPRLAA